MQHVHEFWKWDLECKQSWNVLAICRGNAKPFVLMKRPDERRSPNKIYCMYSIRKRKMKQFDAYRETAKSINCIPEKPSPSFAFCVRMRVSSNNAPNRIHSVDKMDQERPSHREWDVGGQEN